MVSQVSVIGTLMIVNGVLCSIYGIFLIALGPHLQQMLAMQGAPQPPQVQQQMQQVTQWMHVVVMAQGAASALAGVMNIAGGIAALRFRSRVFVIIALFFNILAFGTCYCAPTSLGLLIWGLIVMFQNDVAQAFSLGASGISAAEIKDRMSRGDYHPDDDDHNDDWPSRRPRDDRDPPPKKDGGEGGFRELCSAP